MNIKVGDKVKIVANSLRSHNSIGDIGIVSEIMLDYMGGGRTKSIPIARVKVKGKLTDSNWSDMQELYKIPNSINKKITVL